MRIVSYLILFLFLFDPILPCAKAGDLQKGRLFVSEKGFLYVKLKIEGIEGWNYFLLDFNGRNFIDESKLEMLNIRTRFGNRSSISFDEVVYEGAKWRNQSFRLINAKRRFGSDMIPDSVIGGIGYDFLRNYCWQIDYREKTLLFATDTEEFSFSNDIMEFHAYSTPLDKSLSLYLSLNNGPGKRFVLSTAWPLGICMSPEVFDQKDVGIPATQYLIYPQLRSMKEVEVYTYRLDNVTMNEQIIFQGIPVYLSERFESIIGNDFLSNFLLTIDLNNRRVFLDPHKSVQNLIIKKNP